MRAVNLIPGDAAGGGRAGIGAVTLLGGLATLLALVTVHVLIGNQIADRQSELASAQQQVATVQAQADATRPYREFATLAKMRVATIRQLGSARFDWHRAFADLSVVIPRNVWLTSMTGTVTTGVNAAGGGGGGGPADGLRSAIPNPAITMTGCTVDHDSVVRLISRLRLMHGVQRVALASSSKDGGGDCQHGSTNFPVFNLVVFFAPIPAVQPPVQTQGAGTSAAATSGTPSPAGAPAPASGGPSPGTTSGATTSTPSPTATPASTPPKVVGNG